MKKLSGVIAIIGLAVGLTWAADQVGGWLGFSRQDPGKEDVPPSTNAPGTESAPSYASAASGERPEGEGSPPQVLDISEEVASIEEDLARIEEALESEEVLEEFTPSEPLSADNPIPFPSDI